MRKILFACLLFSSGLFTQNCTSKEGSVDPAGTANVIYSDWIPVTFTGSGSAWSATIVAPKITQEILDKGIVKTYYKSRSSVYEGDAPSAIGGISLIVYPSFAVGAINLRATFNPDYLWRYVIISGGTPLGLGKDAEYEDIKNAYNIPD